MKKVDCFGATDVGRVRENNEDAFVLFSRGKFVVGAVIDGVGGYDGGELTAEISRKVISERMNELTSQNNPREILKTAVIEANNQIIGKQYGNLNSMCCCMTTFILDTIQNKLWVAHVGDTRLFVHNKNGERYQLTHDHHYTNGSLSRALGLERLDWFSAGEYIEFIETEVASSGIILVCSDGIYSMLSDEDIAKIICEEKTAQGSVNTLIREANLAGGKDNCTAIVIYLK